NKAVYAYPSEHYSWWQKKYPAMHFGWGQFGENLTTEGLLESSAGVGDRVRIGTAVLVVVQPRLPCYKLAGKFGDKGILQTFSESGRSGIYIAVEQEGQLQTGDAITWISRSNYRFTISDAMRLYKGEELLSELLDGALRLKALPDSWRERVLQAQAQNKL